MVRVDIFEENFPHVNAADSEAFSPRVHDAMHEIKMDVRPVVRIRHNGPGTQQIQPTSPSSLLFVK